MKLLLFLLGSITAILFAFCPAIQNYFNFIHDRTSPWLCRLGPEMSFPDQDAITLSPANSALQSTCDVAERERYRRIRITADHESIENAFELLMDILKRPSLGEFVERIEYIKTPRYGIQYTGKEYERDLSEEDMHLLRTAVQKAGFTGTREERLINMLMHKTPKNDMRLTEYHGHKFR